MMVSGDVIRSMEDAKRLYFDHPLFAASVHAGLNCENCHGSIDVLPHPPDLPDPNCDGCHAGVAQSYLVGAHAIARTEKQADAPDCWDCHSNHDILPPTDRNSMTYPLNVLKVCGDCHSQHTSMPDVPGTGSELVENYLDSVHGQGIQAAGLAVAANCPDCHRAHDVLPSSNPASSVHRDNIPATCGACHVGVEEEFIQSVHAEVWRNGGSNGDLKPPVCSVCHTAHRITNVNTPAFNRDIVEECGHCHADMYATYRESYHGQVQRLGSRRAARCSDCHGAHKVLAIDNPDSMASAERKLDTCQSCHPGVRPSFAEFIPHANHRDPKYPLLYGIWLYFVIIISATFTFFGIHTILWFIRSFVERVRNGGGHHHDPTAKHYRRFSATERFVHGLVITSFMGLTITGLPLKFSDQPWAVTIMKALGGVNAAGVLHRIFACLMLVYICIHGVMVTSWVLRNLKEGKKGWLFGPDSMLPRWKDATDMLGMFKWFLGIGPLPKFDRWTYWEKFDYWADAVGTVIIGGSGLVLAFPVAVSYILPGWAFNAAMIIHGYEALLAIGFIFTMHFFNAHLRVEKFPTDTVIFTGQISEQEFKEERPEQYARLVEEGRLEDYLVPAKSNASIRIVKILGLMLLFIGLTLVTGIIWAGLSSL